jgi:hypothetical protein
MSSNFYPTINAGLRKEVKDLQAAYDAQTVRHDTQLAQVCTENVELQRQVRDQGVLIQQMEVTAADRTSRLRLMEQDRDFNFDGWIEEKKAHRSTKAKHAECHQRYLVAYRSVLAEKQNAEHALKVQQDSKKRKASGAHSEPTGKRKVRICECRLRGCKGPEKTLECRFIFPSGVASSSSSSSSSSSVIDLTSDE